jgi:lipopolysaccharide biosynthesis glycosyltransferase
MMNIVYTSDNKFSPQIAASMMSVMQNNENEEITFWILSKGITPQNKQLLRDEISTGSPFEIEFIDLKRVGDYFGRNIDTGSWNDIVLARLFLDRLLPDDINRVLYLDGDTIVRGSLHNLWQIDLRGRVIGAVPEPTANTSRKEQLDIPSDGIYYNAGVLLIDLKKWRNERTGDEIVRYYLSHNGKLFANDQDAINGTLKGRIYTLPLCYNWCNTYQIYPFYAIQKMTHGALHIEEEEYRAEIFNPVIVHYLGEERPWREGNRHLYRADFWKYYFETPFGASDKNGQLLLEKGWRRYFVLFYSFNFLLKPFPMIRYNLMNILIPIMIKKRKKS